MHILDVAKKGRVTLIFSSRDAEHNNVVPLNSYLGSKSKKNKDTPLSGRFHSSQSCTSLLQPEHRAPNSIEEKQVSDQQRMRGPAQAHDTRSRD